MNRVKVAVIGFTILLAGPVVLSTACMTEPCTLETKTFEYLYSDIPQFIELQETWLRFAIEDGFNCSSETIRNAFGRSIGTKWTCTRCE